MIKIYRIHIRFDIFLNAINYMSKIYLTCRRESKYIKQGMDEIMSIYKQRKKLKLK